MKKNSLLTLLLLALYSCGGGGQVTLNNRTGELIGTGREQVLQEYPYGMVFIPSGVFTMGNSDPDITGAPLTNLRTVSLSGFFMDDTEVTNDEYRQFVNWVKDSILRESLALKVEELILRRGLEQPEEEVSAEAEVDADTEEEVDPEEAAAAAEAAAAEADMEQDNESSEKKQKDSEFGTGLITPAELEQGIFVYRYARVDTSVNQYYNFVYKKYSEEEVKAARMGFGLNWDIDLNWDIGEVENIDYGEVLESLYKPLAQTITKKEREFDEEKFAYSYYNNGKQVNALIEIDSLKDKDSLTFQEQLLKETIITKVFPDKRVWLDDFSYTLNDPIFNQYFDHVTYDQYPVVGVNWRQALAFASWRTKIRNDYLTSVGRATINDYRLPTEAEWEYAARGGLPSSKYPWGGPYTYDQTGCFLANFKPRRGDYLSDGSLYTAPVSQYNPNGYGLYDMSGNVSEWTGTTFHPSSYMFQSTMNPNFFDKSFENIVVRGGSWKDISYYLQVSTRDYLERDSTSSYLGFRTVLDYVDESNFDQFN